MTAADILLKLEQLALPAEDYVLHSSASLVLRGVLEEAGDIDIVAKGKAWSRAEELVAAGMASSSRGKIDRKIAVPPDIEIYDGWLGEPNEQVVPRSELVGGVPCAPIADVIAFKESLGRPKDRVHLDAIASFLERSVGRS